MTSEQIALAGLGVTVIGQAATAVLVILRIGRADGQLVTEAKVMATEIGRLASAMEKHADELAAVSRDNARQDVRLDEHAGRLDRLDAINDLRRTR